MTATTSAFTDSKLDGLTPAKDKKVHMCGHGSNTMDVSRLNQLEIVRFYILLRTFTSI